MFVEGKSALSEGRDLPGGRRTIDVDTIALQQAFIDFRFHLPRQTTLTLRPGRQALGFGKERLVSILPWGNTLRAWDGISGIY
ncbi:MAG: alginate export family protein, partial [Nitrospinales bacterium]